MGEIIGFYPIVMSLIDKIKTGIIAPLVKEKEDGQAIVSSIKEIFSATKEHFSALGSLLVIELKEASQRLGKKLVLLLITAFMAVIGYLFLWAGIAVYLSEHIGLPWAILSVAIFHFLWAITAFLISNDIKVTPIAPATAEEIKTDVTCLQIALNKNSNS